MLCHSGYSDNTYYISLPDQEEIDRLEDNIEYLQLNLNRDDIISDCLNIDEFTFEQEWGFKFVSFGTNPLEQAGDQYLIVRSIQKYFDVCI